MKRVMTMEDPGLETRFDSEKKLWIIDYDDTLAPNLHDYSDSIMGFVQYCRDAFGVKAPNIPLIVKEEDRIDNEQINMIDPTTGKPFKYTARRFPTALVRTFEYIAEGVEIEGKPFVVTDKHREDVWKIAEFAFDGERYKRQGLLSGAEEALDFLLSTGDELKLVSKGEPWVQQRKFEATNMQRWFGDNIHVVPSKNKEVLLEHAKGYDVRNVWHIGNSIPSDVIPAVEAGVGIVYVKLETWSHEMTHNGLPTYNRLVSIPSLKQFKEIYPLLPR